MPTKLDTFHTAFLFGPKTGTRTDWILVLRNGHKDVRIPLAGMADAFAYMAERYPLWTWDASPILSSDFRGIWS